VEAVSEDKDNLGHYDWQTDATTRCYGQFTQLGTHETQREEEISSLYRETKMNTDKREEKIVMSRKFARASAWTFTIPPFAELIQRYVGEGKNWVDPFAGDNSPAEYTNDIHPERKAKYHMEAEEFCKMIEGDFDGVLFDPPYSYRQISEHYKELGKKATALDTSANFTSRVKRAIAPKIKIGGIAITWGWNSNGFGKVHGFAPIEYLLVGHGSEHNDTICIVERKVNEQIKLI